METGEAFHIGAGPIGRGFIGDVIGRGSALHLSYADIDQGLVDTINREGGFPIRTVSKDGAETHYVDDVEAVSSLDEEAMVDKIVNADIITTAVGAGILAHVAPTLAKGLTERLTRRPHDELHVVVIACENMERNTETLRDYVLAALPDDETRAKVLANFSFPNAAVDRMVLNSKGQIDHPLGVVTEDYYRLAVDRAGLRSSMPDIPGIQVVDNLEAELIQKLFTLNAPHVAAAHLAHLKGYETIEEAMGDKDIRALVEGLMEEVSGVLVRHYPSIQPEAQQQFAANTLRRFLNPYLRDEPNRVGREPIRKLGKKDRLLRPALLALEDGEQPANLMTAIVGGFRFRNPDDPQAVEIAHKIEVDGIDATVVAVTGLHKAHAIVRQTSAGYRFSNLVSRVAA